MKSHKIMLLALTISVIAGGCKKNEKAEQAAPLVDVAYPTVDSVVLHKTFPGLLSAGDDVEVVGRVSGILLTKNYTSGQYVNKGQLLFTIESEKYRDLVRQAEAQLATAQSQYKLYSEQYEARKKALQTNAVSQMDVLSAKSSMEQAEAAIASAKASLSQARMNLSYCTVTAPISGYISPASVGVGGFVGGEGSPVKLCTIYDNSYLIASFDISDSEYESMVGANGGTDGALYRSVPLTFSEDLPHRYSADLFYQSPTVNSSTGTLQLRGNVTNIDNELKDGMYVTVSLPYGTNPKAILVKDASIGTDQLGDYLYVVNDSDKIVYTPIKTGGLYQDSLRIVTDGITAKDRYVTKALLSARDGMKVNPRLTK